MVQGPHTTALRCRDELSEWRCWMTFARDREQTGIAGTGIFWGNNQRAFETSDEDRFESGKTLRPCHNIAESAITQGFGE